MPAVRSEGPQPGQGNPTCPERKLQANHGGGGKGSAKSKPLISRLAAGGDFWVRIGLSTANVFEYAFSSDNLNVFNEKVFFLCFQCFFITF